MERERERWRQTEMGFEGEQTMYLAVKIEHHILESGPAKRKERGGGKRLTSF